MRKDRILFRHADQTKTLGYVVVTSGENGPELGSSRVFGTRDRAENFSKSIDPSWNPQVHKVREETEREAHTWATVRGAKR